MNSRFRTYSNAERFGRRVSRHVEVVNQLAETVRLLSATQSGALRLIEGVVAVQGEIVKELRFPR